MRFRAVIFDAGGTLLFGPTDVFDMGRFAVAADPGGAVFQLWQAGTFPGAGLFNAPFALEAYAQVFDEEGALDRFEAFASLSGPAFYGLVANEGSVTLERSDAMVPDRIAEGAEAVVPYGAGASFGWRLAG